MDECVRVLDHMPERNPTDGTFELTIRCNLHCKMCLFRHDDSENPELMAKELTAEQWIDMARQVAEAGTLSLLITGGEPMLRPDFCEIWEGIYKQGFVITLYTNATLVTPKILETLRKYPPHRIGVTIYGASPETYEKVTGSAAAYQKMLEGTHALLSLPSIVEFRSTVIKDNYADMSAMESLVRDLSDSEAILTESRIVFPSVRGGCADALSCRLDPKENIELYFRRVRKKMSEDILSSGKDPKDYSFKIIQKKEHPLPSGKYKYSLFGCEAGMSSYAVTYNGHLIPCQLLGSFQKDISTSGFIKAWDALPWAVQIPHLCNKCVSCDLIDYCAACPASRYAESGDLGGYSDYLCEDAKEFRKYTELRSVQKEETS